MSPGEGGIDVEVSKENHPMTEELESRIARLLAALTLREKVSLLSGRDDWRTTAVERLGIPSLTMTDGPHGIRAPSQRGRIGGSATSFPTGAAMAASWNPELIERVGAALGEEARALGCDVLLGPCVNIVRLPQAGRNFETLSEDPWLAGRIGAAYVRGVQSRGVGACVKHFACNNQEFERFRGDSIVDERTLREIYLAQFETIVREARPWSVMCSYNRLNGTYASENPHLLREILKEEWGFDGAVISDWGANHTTIESVRAGLDLEMPGPARYYGSLLYDAVRNWQIDEDAVDEAARRILRLLARCGRLDNPDTRPAGAANTRPHQLLARELAGESTTLLRNERGLLPLDPAALRSLAVIGPNAGEPTVSGGGSSRPQPPYQVSPLAALRTRLGDRVRIEYERGCYNHREPPVLGGEYLLPSESGEHGVRGEYFDNDGLAGEPVSIRLDGRPDFWWSSAPVEGLPLAFSARWTGRLAVPADGPYTFALTSTGRCRLSLDGETCLEVPSPAVSGRDAAIAQVELAAGRPYQFVLEFIRTAVDDPAHIRLGFAPTPGPVEDGLLERAVSLAEKADAAVVCVGMPDGYETEGTDRPDLALPGRQDELIRAVARANRNTVVVLNCGAPVSLPWLDEVPAVLLAFYPGQEGGDALAAVLAGEIDPSGRLPVTFPRRLADTPAFLDYPNGREARYGEGIFVGYRWYDKRAIEPAFPFGHGLSYASFAYEDLRAPALVRLGEPVRVSVTVRNTGDRPGKEVVQLYLRDEKSTLPRPLKELKGFAKISLAPGEAATVDFLLDQRALSYYDPYRREWTAEPGRFEVLVGSSSRDIKARAGFALAPEA